MSEYCIWCILDPANQLIRKLMAGYKPVYYWNKQLNKALIHSYRILGNVMQETMLCVIIPALFVSYVLEVFNLFRT